MGTGCLAAMLLGPALAADAQPQRPTAQHAGESDIEPFSSHYVAEWKDISVGVSDLELRRDTQPGHYVYKWTTSARGIFRLVYSDDLVQESWFAIVGDHVKPDRYRGRQGSASVNFDFDWDAGHARGTSEGKPIDLTLEPDTQDLKSIQIQVMLDLKNDNLPATFHVIDKDQIKGFLYAREGTAKLQDRDRHVRHGHRREPPHRQRPARLAHVVRARARLGAGAGRAHAAAASSSSRCASGA